jgi:hypothetical protein
MHRSLSPVFNVAAIAVWAVVVVSFALAGVQANKPLLLGVGGVLGFVAGLCQLHALREEAPRFLPAKTAVEVRRAMMASRFGRYAIYLLWVSAAILLLCVVTQPDRRLFSWLAGYAAFSLARDLVALPGCLDIWRTATAPTSSATQANP